MGFVFERLMAAGGMARNTLALGLELDDSGSPLSKKSSGTVEGMVAGREGDVMP